jgi:hypothetical protein
LTQRFLHARFGLLYRFVVHYFSFTVNTQRIARAY